MRSPLALLLCLAAGASGCQRSDAVVRGTVTVNGSALEEGYITFFPIEGVVSTCGSDIRDGQYEIKKLPAGSWRVLIAPHPSARAVKTKQGDRPVVARSRELAAKADGNNRVVTVSPAEQTLDFHLQYQPGQ